MKDQKIKLWSAISDSQLRTLANDFGHILRNLKYNPDQDSIGYALTAYLRLEWKHKKLFLKLGLPDRMALCCHFHSVTQDFLNAMHKNIEKSVENSQQFH